jgi:hypothetical protein
MCPDVEMQVGENAAGTFRIGQDRDDKKRTGHISTDIPTHGTLQKPCDKRAFVISIR